MWAVMNVYKWESFKIGNKFLVSPPLGTGQPQRLIPVFEKFDDAVKFAGEKYKHFIAKMEVQEEADHAD